MTISIKVTPKTKQVLIDTGPGLIRKHRQGLENALYEIGSDVVEETKRLIEEGPKTGRVYSFRGGRHQASAPGEAPASQTGRLAESGDYIVRNWQEMTVGETAPYAGFLEKGTRNIAPRQHLIKAVNNKAKDAQLAILTNVQDAIE